MPKQRQNCFELHYYTILELEEGLFAELSGSVRKQQGILLAKCARKRARISRIT